MKSLKRAIILDMDQTLEYGDSLDITDPNVTFMTLRPNLDGLIEKLKEAKAQGIDIILCTTAKQDWVERFLTLKPEFRDIFDKKLTRENKREWKTLDEEKYPIEAEAKCKGYDYFNGKPVTTFGYNSILFIDDNRTEGYRLEKLFDLTQGKLDRDVTFFTGYNYMLEKVYEIFTFVEASKKDEQLSKMIAEILECFRSENGCSIMCSVIDDFIQKEYSPGLNFVDDKYEAEYMKYKEKVDELSRKIKEEIETKLCIRYWDLSSLILKDNETKERYENFYKTDKNFPYEGIEDNNKEKLANLVEIATDTQRKLHEAQNLLENYQQREIVTKTELERGES